MTTTTMTTQRFEKKQSTLPRTPRHRVVLHVLDGPAQDALLDRLADLLVSA